MSDYWKVNEKETWLLSIDIKCRFLCSLIFQILFKKHLGALPTSVLSFLYYLFIWLYWVLDVACGIFVALHESFLVVCSFGSCDT